MATAIPTLTVSRAGGSLPAVATAASVYVDENDGNVVVQVYNPTGSEVTITLTPAATVAGLTVTGPTIAIASGATRWVGPFPPAVFNDSDGRAYIVDPSGALHFNGLRF